MAQNDGYSAPFILQDILTQKRAAQHQKLIDSLDLVQQQANMENAAKQREQQAQDAKDTAAYRTGQLQNDAADRLSREKIAMLPARENPPSIVSEYEYAAKNGYKGNFSQYQTEDANRKRVNQPRDTGTYIGPATGPDGQVVPGKHVIMQNGGLRVVDTPGFGLGAKPSNAGAGKKGSNISASEANALAKLRGKATPKPGFMQTVTGGMFGSPSAAQDVDVSAFNQQVQTTISNYPASPDVKDTVRDVLAKENPNTPTADIIKAHAGVFNPQEMEEFSDLLQSVRGE